MPESQGTVESAQDREARTGAALEPSSFPLPGRDVRSKRPPLLSLAFGVGRRRGDGGRGGSDRPDGSLAGVQPA